MVKYSVKAKRKEYSSMTVVQLKTLLRKLGLSAVGLKATLIKRLLDGAKLVQVQNQSQKVVVNIDLGKKGRTKRRSRSQIKNKTISSGSLINPLDVRRSITTNDIARIRNEVSVGILSQEEGARHMAAVNRRLDNFENRLNVGRQVGLAETRRRRDRVKREPPSAVVAEDRRDGRLSEHKTAEAYRLKRDGTPDLRFTGGKKAATGIRRKQEEGLEEIRLERLASEQRREEEEILQQQFPEARAGTRPTGRGVRPVRLRVVSSLTQQEGDRPSPKWRP